MSPETLEQVEVKQLVYGGDGLARLDSGEVLFVPWSAPGDLLKVGVAGKQKKVLHGQIREIVIPSPQRIEPPCSVFGECGGCHWQHIQIEEQREWKRKIVEESLRRLGKLPEVTVNPTLGSGTPWHYRNKVEWVVSGQDSQPAMGYSRLKSHEVVPFDKCWIIPDVFNQLADWLAAQSRILRKVSRIQARMSDAGKILLTFTGERAMTGRLHDLIPEMTEQFPQISGIITHTGEDEETCLWGEALLTETIRGKQFQISPDSFFQVNPDVTLMLLDYLETLIPEPVSTFMDLYAGVGLFSIWLNSKAAHTIALEISEEAVANAQTNLALNGIHNVTLEAGDVAALIKGYEDTVEVSLVDPPRSGCPPEVITWLADHTMDQIIYVSCDPTTLARDLKLLNEAGWSVQSVQPFDMFPQTYHIEVVVSLVPTAS